jgi:hypothetical protein
VPCCRLQWLALCSMRQRGRWAEGRALLLQLLLQLQAAPCKSSVSASLQLLQRRQVLPG